MELNLYIYSPMISYKSDKFVQLKSKPFLTNLSVKL